MELRDCWRKCWGILVKPITSSTTSEVFSSLSSHGERRLMFKSPRRMGVCLRGHSFQACLTVANVLRLKKQPTVKKTRVAYWTGTVWSVLVGISRYLPLPYRSKNQSVFVGYDTYDRVPIYDKIIDKRGATLLVDPFLRCQAPPLRKMGFPPFCGPSSPPLYNLLGHQKRAIPPWCALQAFYTMTKYPLNFRV